MEINRTVREEIANITNQLIKKYAPQKIILFGSAASGELSEDSDIDFLIIKDSVPKYGIDRMRELDRLIETQMPVDMLVYKPGEFEERLRLGDPFIKMILNEGKVLYG